MSTATTSPNISPLPHTPHAPHPIPLREQAFTLHCQGLRSPAISQELGVPERTVRAWIAAALADLKDDLQLNRKEQLLLAVARQHQLTATAWQQFEAEAAARDAILDAALEDILAAAHATDVSARSVTVRLPASTPAPRYLSLILQANKEINRLLGLHTLARLQLLTADGTETDPVPPADFDTPAESATAIAAKTATATESGLAAGLQPANPHPTIPSPSLASASPAASFSAHGAGSRRSVACSEAEAGEGLEVRSPAKSATTPTSTSANQCPRRVPVKPQPWMM